MSDSVIVTADIDSVTILDSTGCATGSAGRTDLGVVIAGDWATSTADCSISFGSNETDVRLDARQSDGVGVAMFRPSSGQADPSFGTAGHVVVDVDLVNGEDEAWTAVQLNDGSLLVAGRAFKSGVAKAFSIKYDKTGAVDPSWAGGPLVLSYSGTDSDWEGVTNIRVQPDGKILYISDILTHNYVLHRLHPNGTNDTSFGSSNGQRRLLPCGGSGSSLAMDLAPDGKVLVAGQCSWTRSSAQRFTASGSLDNNFASGNFEQNICPNPGGGGQGGRETFSDVLGLEGGDVLLLGWCEVAPNAFDALIVRLNDDGTYDTGFDGDGILKLDLGSSEDRGYVLKRQPDGKVIIAGGGDDGAFELRRIDPATGALDTDFGTAGVVSLPVGNADSTAYVRGVALEYDGRILIAGDACIGTGDCRDQVVMRLMPDGDPDTSFNATGTLVIQHGSSNDYAFEVASAADGQIVIAGSTQVGTATRATVTRLNSDTIPQHDSTATTRWSDRSDGFFAVCLRTVGGDALADSTEWIAPLSGTCGTSAASDPDWRAVPASTALRLADTTTMSGSVDLRFAIATRGNQSPGAFVAPVTFELIALP